MDADIDIGGPQRARAERSGLLERIEREERTEMAARIAEEGRRDAGERGDE